jgi:hypothetical protein
MFGSKIMETMLDRTLDKAIVAAFLRTSALALGIDPGRARRAMRESIEYPRSNPRAIAGSLRARTSLDVCSLESLR